MKFYSKLALGIVALTTGLLALLAADVVYPIYTANTPPLNYPTTNSAAMSSSNAVVVALNAQILLLKELIQEHQKRAADVAQKSPNENAKWETDLVNELQEKSDRLQKSIDQAAQTGLATSDAKASPDVDDQLIFLSTVEAGLQRTRQEISAAIADGHLLAIQIGTNKVSEDLPGLTLALSENQRRAQNLQREEFDLDLRKLEFRALSRLMQK
jgi:hypothetical protein